MPLATKKLYRPRTQKAALAYASRQAEDKTDRIHRYFAQLIYKRMSELEHEIIGELSNLYHGWYRSSAWNYADMVAHHRRETLWYSLKSIIDSSFHALADESMSWLETGYVFGSLGFLYVADAITPPTIRPRVNLTRSLMQKRLHQAWSAERGGGSVWLSRLAHQADQLFRELQRTLEQSMLQAENLQDALSRVGQVFGSEHKRHVKTSESLREQGLEDTWEPPIEEEYVPPTTGPSGPSGIGTAMGEQAHPIEGFIDQELWDQAVENLRTVMDWEHRNPGYEVPDGGAAYEAERNIMTEYSRGVRMGQIDAQMPNGEVIEDFVWVAVIDDHTCEDCMDRADMTMSEIAEKFGDDSAPPLHYLDRCALIPSLPDFQPLAGDWESEDVDPGDRLMTDPDTGQTGYPQIEGFDTWLDRL